MRRFVSEDNRFAVELRGRQARKLRDLCDQAFPNETGGILVGRYSKDHRTASFTEILRAPRDSVFGRFSFQRGVRGLAEKLLARWRRPAPFRRYYLGEWHSHPEGLLIPSARDQRQMQKIAEGAYHCPEPVLLLLAGGPGSKWRIGTWVFQRDQGMIPLQPSGRIGR